MVLPLSIVLAIASGVAPEQGWFATRTSRACWRHERSRLFRIERAGQKKAIMECAHNFVLEEDAAWQKTNKQAGLLRCSWPVCR